VSGRLPKPEGWRPQVFLIVAAVLVVPVFFGTTLWWLIASLVNGQYASTVVAVGVLLVLLGFALAVTVTKAGLVEPSGDFDDVGTYVFVDQMVGLIMLATAIVMIPTAVLFLSFYFTGAIVLPHTRKGNAPLIVAAVLALIGAVTMIKGYRRRTMGQVRLTPKGFGVYESGREFGGKWVDVAEVTSAPPPVRKRSERKVKPVVFNMTDGSVLAINGADSYTPGGQTLYWMARYYWRNPDKRGELTDGRALKRVYDERFPTD
jgi:hypothetical protein